MLISVKILQGKECSIEVSTSSSISAVKHLVARELQIPVDQQRLVFKGKTLADSQCLCDYNIVDGNKLHLFVRKGGEFMPESTTVLWSHLQKVLDKHFSLEDGKKVLEEFKREFASSMDNLSLDDIERLAVYNLGTDAVPTSTHIPDARDPQPQTL